MQIGIDVNEVVRGMICIEHFNKIDLLVSKSGEIRLRKGSTPTDVNEHLSHISSEINNLSIADDLAAVNTENEANEAYGYTEDAETPVNSVVENLLGECSMSPDPECQLNRCCKLVIAEKELMITNMKAEYTQQMQQFKSKIRKLEEKINQLKKKNKSLQNHSYHLEKTKSNVESVILDLQKKHKNAELIPVLEVMFKSKTFCVILLLLL